MSAGPEVLIGKALSSAASLELRTMAGRSVSPGAALLRSSRMFSMPAPIPPPPGDFSSATRHYSPTSTIPFPTHLTVTTTASSRVTGDWGFKRPLPLRTTTKTTYPLARVRQVDSVEQVTDFQSASDHTVTLWKYQEMNLPITVPIANAQDTFSTTKHLKSVFEEDSDLTALDDKQKVELVNKRWKFTGPWLAGMTNGDFKKFIEKKVRNRRADFRAFLKKIFAAEMSQKRAREAEAAGEPVPPEVSVDEISEDELTEYLRKLRQDRMTLYNLVSRFLDLAPVDLQTSLSMLGQLAPGTRLELARGSPYGADGPPITHPSAGLSYLRTRNFQENHALYGPQLNHAPVKARVLKPTNFTTNSFNPSIGVAGFVASMPTGDTSFNTSKQRNLSEFNSALHKLDLEKYGGSKVYVQPHMATVNSAGRILVNVEEANSESQLVQKELVGEGTIYDDLVKKGEIPQIPRNPRYTGSFSARPGSRIPGNAGNYGLGRSPRSYE
ncbi:mitochondrial ribosomal protein MRP51 [Daldinia caldariorum]|uniref:mitochondrial ribosomal protein MRP51 n=1 Tax=Daldinia caldariorum TaxID=326644 RepID=UPI002007907F|nr:mitochondrial ribosomal protein MRP51 [Daldinia caldariorum]KAI1470802.1 mitochondrial ribosomal protein MRP51 [Daldinia caldariorum]